MCDMRVRIMSSAAAGIYFQDNSVEYTKYLTYKFAFIKLILENYRISVYMADATCENRWSKSRVCVCAYPCYHKNRTETSPGTQHDPVVALRSFQLKTLHASSAAPHIPRHIPRPQHSAAKAAT